MSPITNLADLNKPLKDEVDFNNLPEQGRGAYPDPPPVGAYRFQLPAGLSLANFDEVQSTDYGKRVSVRFKDDQPLVIVQSAASKHDGEPFQTSISNVPRERGKKGSGVFASDWDYLNQALGEKKRPATNKAYIDALIVKSNAAGGSTFGADVEYSWSCNDQRPAYFDDGQGGTAKAVGDDGEEKKGCGKKYYQGTVSKVEGAFPVRITCECGATIRAFGNLTRFRA